MLKTKDIIDEYDKRIRLKSKDVTFPLDEKTKKTIEDSIEMLRLSQIEEYSEKYDLRPGMGLSLIQLGIAKNEDLWEISYNKRIPFAPLI